MNRNFQNLGQYIDARKKEIMKANPFFYSLPDKEREIVNSIAMQIPISCETVARIYLIYGGSDRQKTLDFILKEYGFTLK